MYPTVIEQAGALIHGVATAHGFQEGNKRTSWISGMAYLDAKGFEIRHMSDEEAGKPLLALINKKIDLAHYTQWLAGNLV